MTARLEKPARRRETYEQASYRCLQLSACHVQLLKRSGDVVFALPQLRPRRLQLRVQHTNVLHAKDQIVVDTSTRNSNSNNDDNSDYNTSKCAPSQTSVCWHALGLAQPAAPGHMRVKEGTTMHTNIEPQ